MISHAHDLRTWPRGRNGQPIFTCSEDAIYFAHLAHDQIFWVDMLIRLRKKAYMELAYIRKRAKPDYQKMMDLAVKAQFYRECLEEITRINDSQHEL